MKPTNWQDVRRDGGLLCFDFTNTVGDRTVESPRDYLGGFDDLRNWLAYTESVPPERLRQVADRLEPDQKERLLTRARELRELLFDLFFPITENHPPPAAGLERFNDRLERALPYRRLALHEKRVSWEWSWAAAATEPEVLLGPVVLSAADALTEGDHARIKACPACRWLFYDHSKNGRRTWCSMKACGSQNKAREYYRRKKTEKQRNRLTD